MPCILSLHLSGCCPWVNQQSSIMFLLLKSFCCTDSADAGSDTIMYNVQDVDAVHHHVMWAVWHGQDVAVARPSSKWVCRRSSEGPSGRPVCNPATAPWQALQGKGPIKILRRRVDPAAPAPPQPQVCICSPLIAATYHRQPCTADTTICVQPPGE